MSKILEIRSRYIHHFPDSYEREASDRCYLGLALCGECGELANQIKKEIRDGVYRTAKIQDEIADVRLYLELLAKLYFIEGDKLDQQVEKKLQRRVKEIIEMKESKREQ